MRDGEQRVTGGRAAALPVDAPEMPPDQHHTHALLRRGADTVEELLLGGCLTADATGHPRPQLTHHLLEELRATTARLVDLDRRLGAPRVLRDAERHVRTLAALLARTPDHSRLRPRLLLVTGEAALFNASLALDQDEIAVGGRWARLAASLAYLAGIADLATAAVTLQARLLLAQGDPCGALRTFRQVGVARPSARAQAFAHGWEAIAHATRGEHYETMAALDRSEAALERSVTQPPSWWFPIPPATGMVCAESQSYLGLGKPDLSYAVLDRARAAWPTNLHRGSGELLAVLARAALEIGEVEQACAHATTALRVARSTGSRKQLRLLAALADQMTATFPAPAAASEFRRQLGLVPAT